MKRIIPPLAMFVLALAGTPQRSHAQAQELEQLALDIEKLTQFKSILSDMKEAYTIISDGYDKVKGVTQGNFSLHEAFIDGLLLVNPNIRNYGRIADIISYQSDIIKEYQGAFNSFRNSNLFRPEEISYMGDVYGKLLDESVGNLDELTLIITESDLRMSDAERLSGIDRIYNDMKDKLAFLRTFNRKNDGVLKQRQQLQQQQTILKNLYGQ